MKITKYYNYKEHYFDEYEPKRNFIEIEGHIYNHYGNQID